MFFEDNKDARKILNDSNIYIEDVTKDNCFSSTFEDLAISRCCKSDTIYEIIEEGVCYNWDTNYPAALQWIYDNDAAEDYMEEVMRDGIIDTGVLYRFDSHADIAYRTYYLDELWKSFEENSTIIIKQLLLYCLEEYMREERDLSPKHIKKIIKWIDDCEWLFTLDDEVSFIYAEVVGKIEEIIAEDDGEK